MLKRALFHFARSPFTGRLAGWGFQHASGVIPVQKVFQDEEVLAFRHPPALL